MDNNQLPNIDNIVVGHAKKKEGYYVCPLGHLKSKTPFTFYVQNAKLLDVKDSSNTVLFKCKSMAQYFDDLNTKIISLVKTHSNEWFSTNIDVDLIDEYYISTLHYDRKTGETMRIKVKNVEEIEEEHFTGKVSFLLTLKFIKFLKQKFFLEFEIVEVKSCLNNDAFQDVSDDSYDMDVIDDEDLITPSVDEVNTIKNDTLQLLHNRRHTIRRQIVDHNDILKQIENAIGNLEKACGSQNIIKLCEDYQILVE